MSYWEDEYDPAAAKGKAFALRISDMDKYLNSEKKEFLIANQVFRS